MDAAEAWVTGPTVAMISLEPWDAVWRRNQHLAHQLVAQRLVAAIVFVEPPAPFARRCFRPEPGIEVVRPVLLAPRRLGGLRATGAMLRRRTGRADVLWVNDAPFGAACRRRGQHTVYDVTDDWRTLPQPPRITRRVVGAEDLLVRDARVVVCSTELRDRWRQRYGIDAPVVHNGVDETAFAGAVAHPLAGDGPHAGYVGTLHGARLDIDAVLHLAAAGVRVHLVGPDSLTTAERARLDHPRIDRHGAVAAADVPGWLVSFDVLICPHRVTDFTRSLDAIKSYEYLAAGRPVVATPTSGFQHLAGRAGVTVVDSECFTEAVRAAVGGVAAQSDPDATWAARAVEFAGAAAFVRAPE